MRGFPLAVLAAPPPCRTPALINHDSLLARSPLDAFQVRMRTQICCYMSAFASICSDANLRLCCVSEQQCENSLFYVVQSNEEDSPVSSLIDPVAQVMERRQQQTRGAVTSGNNEAG